ncbi:MAG: DUF3307 domain-containing protein [Bdellovibrionaceae bacterium]|jgi:hypothetical protein|nr:DUF3307 domain-containing protein [Pseudobdellovibrionaceae bacterium]
MILQNKIEIIFLLMVLFQLKHFLADFPLQGEYMLKKTLSGWGFVAPLSLHSGIHAILTLGIVAFFAPQLYWLAIFDFVIHFLMDRIKSGERYLGRFNDKSKSMYWNIFGLDQMVHHLTHIFIVYKIVESL